MTATRLEISLAAQTLTLYSDAGVPPQCYPVSTAARGAGERKGSYQTPRGLHYVRAKIGASCPPGTVFVRRRPTGEIYSAALAAQYPGRDWILTRILWLCGKEVGKNRLGGVDTFQRYIYLHGTPDTEPMGVPASHGCIRMQVDDLLAVFAATPVGSEVYLRE
jgi:lipoprotein-anchoring transpeptidase ErfK/SrfK